MLLDPFPSARTDHMVKQEHEKLLQDRKAIGLQNLVVPAQLCILQGLVWLGIAKEKHTSCCMAWTNKALGVSCGGCEIMQFECF